MKTRDTHKQYKYILVKSGEMACGKNYFMSLRGQNSSWQKLIYTGGKANERKRNRKLGAL